MAPAVQSRTATPATPKPSGRGGAVTDPKPEAGDFRQQLVRQRQKDRANAARPDNAARPAARAAKTPKPRKARAAAAPEQEAVPTDPAAEVAAAEAPNAAAGAAAVEDVVAPAEIAAEDEPVNTGKAADEPGATASDAAAAAGALAAGGQPPAPVGPTPDEDDQLAEGGGPPGIGALAAAEAPPATASPDDTAAVGETSLEDAPDAAEGDGAAPAGNANALKSKSTKPKLAADEWGAPPDTEAQQRASAAASPGQGDGGTTGDGAAGNPAWAQDDGGTDGTTGVAPDDKPDGLAPAAGKAAAYDASGAPNFDTSLRQAESQQGHRNVFAPAPAQDPAMPPEARFAAANHQNIVREMRAELLPGGGSMKIRLDPPQLGALQVTVQMRDGVVTAAFETSNDEATKLLGHSLNQLKAVLESHGVGVDKLQVQQAPRNEHADAPRDDPNARRDSRANDEGHAARQEQQRKEMLRKMWRRLSGGVDPFDVTG